jgi:hypothetical protein
MVTCTTKNLCDVIFILDYSWCHFKCKGWRTSKQLLNVKVYIILWTIVHCRYLCYGDNVVYVLIKLNEFIEPTRVLIESSRVGVWSLFS